MDRLFCYELDITAVSRHDDNIEHKIQINYESKHGVIQLESSLSGPHCFVFQESDKTWRQLNDSNTIQKFLLNEMIELADGYFEIN